MSNRFKSVVLFLLIVLVAAVSWQCEKDDICDPATPVTPRLVIDFYTSSNNLPAVVPQLQIISADYDTIYRNVSSIKLPLRLVADQSTFEFILTIENQQSPLVYSDAITFNYSRTNEYVSRACGYKTIFDLNNDINLTPAFLLNGNYPLVTGSWIKNILIDNYSITSENQAHVKIYY